MLMSTWHIEWCATLVSSTTKKVCRWPLLIYCVFRKSSLPENEHISSKRFPNWDHIDTDIICGNITGHFCLPPPPPRVLYHHQLQFLMVIETEQNMLTALQMLPVALI